MKSLARTVLTFALLLVMAACKPKASNDVEGGKKAAASVSLCTACGEFDKSKTCCDKDAEKCAKCGLNKGSIGCCVIKKGSKDPVKVCTGCGELKGSKKCCASDAKVCVKCGLNEGSPGCCKLAECTSCSGHDHGGHKH